MRSWAELCSKVAIPAGLSGLEIEHFPYISSYGLFIRVMRTNCFSASGMYSTLALRAGEANSDVVRAANNVGSPAKRLRDALGIDLLHTNRIWDPKRWCPISFPSATNVYFEAPRHCRVCLAYGYHCQLFQMPFVQTCPWHGVKLAEGCARCGRRYHYSLFGEKHAAVCDCGHDAVDLKKATAGLRAFAASQQIEEFCAPYLDRCAYSSGRFHVIGGRAAVSRIRALSVFVDEETHNVCTSIPANGGTKDIRRRLWRVESSAHRPGRSAGEMNSWVMLSETSNLQNARLPQSLHRPLIAISSTVVETVPDVAPIVFIDDCKQKIKWMRPKDLVAKRPHHIIMPFSDTLHEDSWINLSVVLPSALTLCSDILKFIDQLTGDGSLATVRQSKKSVMAGTLERLEIAPALCAALKHLVLNGFAIGFQIALRRLSKDTKSRCLAASWPDPVALVTVDGAQAQQISIAWLKD